MRAAVVAIGDELTCGFRLDTNSQAISRRLATVPLEVVAHLTVGDSVEAIQTGLRTALGMAEVVVVAGGLGPTEDDLTRQAVAAHFGLDLVEDGVALSDIRQRFARRGRVMPESNRIQACVPAGSQIIRNDRGTAAGFYLPGADRHLFVTPGIPYEMEGMLEGFIVPRLRQLVARGLTVRQAVLKVYGMPESEINEVVRPLLARDRNPLLGLLPHRGTITIEIVARAETAPMADALLAADLAVLRERLGRYVISEDGRELPQVVADLLAGRGLTVATAEVGTGGLLAALLTEPPGSARWFRRGVTGAEEGGEEVTGPAPSPAGELVLGQAAAARCEASADVAVAVGPVHVPPDSTAQHPYGQVDVAIDVAGQATWRRLSFNGDGPSVRAWAADGALALLRERLLESV